MGMCGHAMRVQRGCRVSVLECMEVAMGLQRGAGLGGRQWGSGCALVSPALPQHLPEERWGRAGPQSLSSEPLALGRRHQLVSAREAEAGTQGTWVGKGLRWIAKAITPSRRCPPEITPVPDDIHLTPHTSNLPCLQSCGDSQQNTGQAWGEEAGSFWGTRHLLQGGNGGESSSSS